MTVQELLAGSNCNAPIEKRAITNLDVLNEAYDYAKPSSFSRGMRIDLNGLVILLISGTASIDENGVTVHIGDFRAQMPAHLPEHHRPAGSRRRDLARHRAHHLLPARYRSRLRGVQRRAHRVLHGSSNSIRCRLRLESRPSCAVPSCWSRSKPLRCSGVQRPRSNPCARAVLMALLVALASGAWAQTFKGCACGKNPPGRPAERTMKPYAQEPEDMQPFSKFTQPYYQHYVDLVEYNGAARDLPVAKGCDRSAHRLYWAAGEPSGRSAGQAHAEWRQPGRRRGQRRRRIWRQAVST